VNSAPRSYPAGTPKHLTFRTGDAITTTLPDGHTVTGTFIDRHTITTGGQHDTQALVRMDTDTYDTVLSFETIHHA
jgi:hypothetical protein